MLTPLTRFIDQRVVNKHLSPKKIDSNPSPLQTTRRVVSKTWEVISKTWEVVLISWEVVFKTWENFLVRKPHEYSKKREIQPQLAASPIEIDQTGIFRPKWSKSASNFLFSNPSKTAEISATRFQVWRVGILRVRKNSHIKQSRQ